LRIGLFEVSEKGRVGELLHTRGVVGHDNQRPSKVGCFVKVAVLALMGALNVAEVSGSAFARDGSFCHPRHGGGVVRAAGDGSIGDGVVVGDEHDLAQQACVFKIAVGDHPCAVV
jgi:hypothetical protein